MKTANSTSFDDLLRRICAEYAEMPGLRVTSPQAQRLWGLDASTCREVLDCLIDVRFLTVTPAGQYVRLTDGPATIPTARMLKSALQRTANHRRAV